MNGIMEALPEEESWTGQTPSAFYTVALKATSFSKLTQLFGSPSLFIVFC